MIMNEGKRLSQHPHNREKDKQQSSLLFVLIVIAAIAYVAFTGLNFYFPVQLVLLFVLMIPFALWLTITSGYRLWLHPSIELYEQGVRYSDRRRTRFWRWEEIGDIRSQRPNYSQIGRYGLYVNNKRVLLINDTYQRGAELVNQIVAELLSRKSYSQTFARGETIRAGKLTVDRSGVTVNKTMVPWSELQGIWPDNHANRAQINRANQNPLHLSIRGVPNAPVVAQLINQTLAQVKPAPLSAPARVNPDLDGPPEPALSGVRLVSRHIRSKSLLWIILALFGIGVGLYVIVPSAYNGLQYHFVDVTWILWGLAALIIPLIGLRLLLVEAYSLFQNPLLTVDAAGLRRSSRSGETYWRWNDISEVSFVKIHNWFGKVGIGLRLNMNDESGFILDNRFTEANHLGLAIQTAQANALYPKYKARLTNGETLHFGPITLDLIGIQHGSRSYLWNDMVSVDITNIGNETNLVIYGPNNKRLLATTIFGIPNLQILQRLIRGRLPKDISSSLPAFPSGSA